VLLAYNICRTFARGLAAVAATTLMTGEAKPFGLHFADVQAVLLAVALLCLAVAAFTLESMGKQRAGV
jgi:hypothetical protein